MLARDRVKWPGGCMCGFMLWVRERWGEWKQSVGYWSGHCQFRIGDGVTMEAHYHFDQWLSNFHRK